jgi:hypothetical protein
MVHVFCNQRGSGKTKALINLANQKALETKGHIIFINDDSGLIHQLDRKIRLIPTNEFSLKKQESFYGFLCGILSEDYDIDAIFIDGLFNIIEEDLENAAHLFYALENLSKERGLEFFINVNQEQELPEFMRKYVA